VRWRDSAFLACERLERFVLSSTYKLAEIACDAPTATTASSIASDEYSICADIINLYPDGQLQWDFNVQTASAGY
jgi:hypothetical protein